MHEMLVPWLQGLDADVICLQEVTRTPHVSGWATFADGERTLPQRLNLLDDVSSSLLGYQPHFVANDAGPVTDGDGTERQQDFGIATWVKADFPVVSIESRAVHSQFVDYTAWSVDDRPRSALTVAVHDRQGQRVVSVIQLHGLRDPAGKHDTPARLDQAKRLIEIVERAQSSSDVTILCGDLNLLPDSETFTLLGGQGMVDLVGSADTRASSYTKPVRSASYLLVSSTEAVRSFDIVATPEVSDHRALLLEI